MSSSREIIHLSFGSEACGLTAHWLNLQGLASTSNDPDHDVPLCDSNVTQTTLGSSSNLLVPRAILMDTPTSHDKKRSSGRKTDYQQQLHSQDAWSGKVEPLNVNLLDDSFTQNPMVASMSSSIMDEESSDDAFDSFLQTARTLAETSFSRYRTTTPKSNRSSSASVAQKRHFDWDDLEEEDDEDEDERNSIAQQKQQQQQSKLYSLQQANMDAFWKKTMAEAQLTKNSGSSTPASPHPILSSWRNYFMPPYSPKSILSLPLEEDTFLSGNIRQDMVEDLIRWLLEGCNSCQGVVLTSSGHGYFAGQTAHVLEYLSEECPSSQRWLVDAQQDSGSSVNESWRSRHINTMRSSIESGLWLQSQVTSSHAVLPLSAPKSFPEAAWTAAALESATLPYRLQNRSSKAKLSLNSHFYGTYGGETPFGFASSVSLSEFLKILTPSPKHTILELDALSPFTKNNDGQVWQSLQEGTSVQRDHRMRSEPTLSGSRRPRDVLPGVWMLPPSSSGSLSPLSPSTGDRSAHQHFSLLSSLRGPLLTESAPLNQYLTCLMEGMGVRYRPEHSMACVAQQTFSELTENGYASGSYWKALEIELMPALAVIGNTTRSHVHLAATALKMKAALSPQLRGLYNRDVSSGFLPEEDDCIEALSFCMDVRDNYRPPDDELDIDGDENF